MKGGKVEMVKLKKMIWMIGLKKIEVAMKVVKWA